ncbi:MAG: response regulator [Candidatus Omnitrophica bacterium]|nr:response regulator [Candidatus Omnitrophota bacterium]
MKNKVLVVDDEKEIVDFLEHFLQRLNIEVFKAVDGSAAIDLYNLHSPDCTILDITMPGKDGLEVLREIRKTNPQATVIMLTGKEEQEYQEKAKKYGAADYITKPLDLAELNRKIKKYI